MTGIRQLAERLDVSIGTVSRALNDRPGVNAETRAKVLRAAEELGYVANAPARSLRRGATSTIGLVIETGSPAALEGDNFFLALADAMQDPMSERGYDLVLLPTRHAADPQDALRRTIRRGTVDALVLTATRRHDPRIELLLQAQLPFLALGRSETPGSYSWIDLDFEGVARVSVDELVRLGHRRIAIGAPTGDANLSHLYVRAAMRALADHGLAPEAAVFWITGSEPGGVDLLQRILKLQDRPSAVITCSEPVVTGLYSALAQAGLQPGRDLSVIGCRDNPQRRYLSPPPSCFEVGLDGLGMAVAQAVTDIAARKAPGAPPPQRIIWPMRFRATGSIGPQPA